MDNTCSVCGYPAAKLEENLDIEALTGSSKVCPACNSIVVNPCIIDISDCFRMIAYMGNAILDAIDGLRDSRKNLVSIDEEATLDVIRDLLDIRARKVLNASLQKYSLYELNETRLKQVRNCGHTTARNVLNAIYTVTGKKLE